MTEIRLLHSTDTPGDPRAIIPVYEVGKIELFQQFLSQLPTDTFGGLTLYADFAEAYDDIADDGVEPKGISRRLALVGRTPETHGVIWRGYFRTDLLEPVLRMGHIWEAKISGDGSTLRINGDDEDIIQSTEIIPRLAEFLEYTAKTHMEAFNAFKSATVAAFSQDAKVSISKAGEFKAVVESPAKEIRTDMCWRELTITARVCNLEPHIPDRVPNLIESKITFKTDSHNCPASDHDLYLKGVHLTSPFPQARTLEALYMEALQNIREQDETVCLILNAATESYP